ncbi:MAG: hypothetical protein US55_C0015G0008, partial [Candidatus Levybacteria bacterium GW2011_GWC2_37_7]
SPSCGNLPTSLPASVAKQTKSPPIWEAFRIGFTVQVYAQQNKITTRKTRTQKESASIAWVCSQIQATHDMKKFPFAKKLSRLINPMSQKEMDIYGFQNKIKNQISLKRKLKKRI